MPKKFKGGNSKAKAARERKEAAKKADRSRKKKQQEDEYWKDDGPSKEKKRREKERKKFEKEQARLRKKKLLEEENKRMEKYAAPKQKAPQKKLFRADIERKKEQDAEKQKEAERRKRMAAKREVDMIDLEENSNIALSAQMAEDRARYSAGVLDATNLDDALNGLTLAEDRHPEKRMKQAYKAYYDLRFDTIRAENPSLKYSQWRNLCWEEFLASPSNPKNQSSSGQRAGGKKRGGRR